MIYYIEGILREKNPSSIVVETGGVGFEIKIPFYLFEKLPSCGRKVKIYAYLHQKENFLDLYGFLTPEERKFFLTLISLSSIGPRSALRMLSGITPRELKKAVAEKDLGRLVQTPGIGKKTAQRLLLELGGVLKEWKEKPSFEDKTVQDAVSALVSLGYTKSQAEEAVKKALQEKEDIKKDIAALIKESLRYV